MPSLQIPIVRRYLWAQGSVSISLQSGTMLAGRYQVMQFPLLLDTLPAEPPVPLNTVPPLAEPYLSLSPFLVAIPRPFTLISLDAGETLLLLEEVPIATQELTSTESPPLLPTLTARWDKASAFQQIVWLWQIARLWQPFVDNHVAVTLLDWHNIRVDEEDVRLLSLQIADQSPTLIELGHQWRPLVQTAAKPLRDYLTQLTDVLISGEGSATGLVNSLTQTLDFLSAGKGVSVELATYSDQGPTRQRNEDACYPSSGSVSSVSVKAAKLNTTPAPYVVVCDGIGGHQGGNVASQIAIDRVTQHLQTVISVPNLACAEIISTLEKAVLIANQDISNLNDADQRQDRDRMGTTIVIALVYGARLYIAHLGDSRAYRVRLHNCRQITLDDDVAAREMRLGLELYQDALQTPGAGSLVQALGMADSRYLHPTVELYPLVTESVFLLCSDGLSDHDLIDQLWTKEIRPLVTGERDVALVGQRLIELANAHNGHDNVTVGLLRVAPEPSKKEEIVPTDFVHLLKASEPTIQTVMPEPITTAVPPQRSRRFPSMLVSVFAAILLGAVGVYYWEEILNQVQTLRPGESETGETLSPSAAPPTPNLDLTANELSVGDYLQVQQIPQVESLATMTVTATPPTPEPPAAVDLPSRILPVGSIVQVVNRQKTPDDQLWVRIEVCSASTEVVESGDNSEAESAPTTVASSPEVASDRALPLAQPGDQGWLLETSLPNFASRLLDTSATQQGLCID